jgi:hypothetical protein
MDSIDLTRLESVARRRYELRRLLAGVLGFAPVLAVVAVATALGRQPLPALGLGGLLFAVGVAALWRGEAFRKAVLPGVFTGFVPLALALGFNLTHGCDGDHCTMVCLPACSVGGLVAGLAVSTYLARRRLPWPAWGAAASMSLLTGAMGCVCVGSTGILGLAAGFALGAAPVAVRQLRAAA